MSVVDKNNGSWCIELNRKKLAGLRRRIQGAMAVAISGTRLIAFLSALVPASFPSFLSYLRRSVCPACMCAVRSYLFIVRRGWMAVFWLQVGGGPGESVG